MALFPQAACLQMEIQAGNVDANLEQLNDLLALHQPVAGTLFVLPELWATGFDYPAIDQLARQTPRVLAELQKLAVEHSISFAGSLLEQMAESAPCNTLFLSTAQGVDGRYQKRHLFSFWKEDKYLQAGTAV